MGIKPGDEIPCVRRGFHGAACARPRGYFVMGMGNSMPRPFMKVMIFYSSGYTGRSSL